MRIVGRTITEKTEHDSKTAMMEVTALCDVQGALDRNSVLGDPEFHAARLKPLEDELAAYAKRVSPEMTDADVTDIFVHALPGKPC